MRTPHAHQSLNTAIQCGECAGLTAEDGTRKPLILGRREYSVRSLDADTGDERWNVSYSRIRSIASPFGKTGFDEGIIGSTDVFNEKESTCAGMPSLHTVAQ